MAAATKTISVYLALCYARDRRYRSLSQVRGPIGAFVLLFALSAAAPGQAYPTPDQTQYDPSSSSQQQSNPDYPRNVQPGQTYGVPDQSGVYPGVQTIPDTNSPTLDQQQRQGQYPYPNDYGNQGVAGRGQTQNGQDRNVRQNQLQLPRGVSLLPRVPLTDFQKVVLESTGREVPIFGADLFRTPPSTFAPVENIPVTPDYVIGPGDELRLQIWGQVNHRGSYVVDRTGAIALPGVGSTHVAGLRYTQLTDFLRAQLGRVYRNFDLNVNLGQLRSIQVFVVGKAKQPGSYTVGSLSTLLNALFASGGPDSLGSLRDIQLRRNGETVTHFDLYDLLLHGDKSKDVPLASGDVIFIPDVGAQVAVLGSVKSPAIYELHAEKSFQEVVALAGGETNVAAGTTARVERILNHTERNVIDVDLKTSVSPAVQDGDVVIVNEIVDRLKDAVTLRGNVANPGRFAWHSGMHVLDLIPSREALVTRDYYRRRNQLGQLIVEDRTQPFPGRDEVNGVRTSRGVSASDEHQVMVTGTDNASGDGRRVVSNNSVGGSGGAAPVSSALTSGSERFPIKNDVVLNAPDIDWDYAVIERQNAETLTTSLIPFNLGKAVLAKDSSQNVELLAGDVITIFSKADIRVPSAQQTKFVKLEGEFPGAGTYSALPGETLRHLLTRAGGLTTDAYLFASEFTRDSVRRVQKQRLLEYADSLESQISAQTSSLVSSALTDRDAAAAEASEAAGRASLARIRQLQPTGRVVLQLRPESRGLEAVPDIELEDGDRFVVPKIPATVNVVGQVYSPNAFVFEPNRRVRDYLRLAGGPDRLSDQKRAFIQRADGSVLSHQYASARHFGDFDHIVILPGDTIVVPPKLVRGTALRELANVATILQGFGISAAAIQVLR